MKCVLLALALLCAAQAASVPQPTEMMTGVWYSMFAASDKMSFLDQKEAPFRVYVNSMAVTPEDNLKITFSKWDNDKCVQSTIFAQKTQKSNEFVMDNEGQMLTLTLVDVDDTGNAILCIKVPTTAADQGTMCEYISKTKKPNKEYVEKFNEILKTQFKELNIYLNMAQEDELCRM